jgi:hypothetical protein
MSRTQPLITSAIAVMVPCLFATTDLHAQQSPSLSSTLTTVPRLVRITSTFSPANGLLPAPVETVTLAIYAEATGGPPLWQETQTIVVDTDGRYTLLLGATLPDGLPLQLFASGEARWLGRRFERPGEIEQPRVLLASVPYALKASDADTLGGRPPSAYLLAEPGASERAGATKTAAGAASAGASGQSSPASALPLSAGTVNYVGKFVNSTDLGNSAIYDAGGFVGVNTTTPFDVLHARFTNTNGGLTGYAVQNLGNTPTSYSGMLFYDQNGALGQFQGFNNVTHEYRINNIASGGSINFMIGSSSKFQVRPDGDVNIAGSIRKGGLPFLHSFGTENTFLGTNAGNFTMTGSYNAAAGVRALYSNTTGSDNTASGLNALASNTTGSFNTASGASTLFLNATGSYNTASGFSALAMNKSSENTATGAYALAQNVDAGHNTATGVYALYSNTSGFDNTATGASALRSSTGSSNTATGANALASNTTSGGNTATGANALTSNTTGGGNTATGTNALIYNTTGGANTATGYFALFGNTLGLRNTASGYWALGNNETGENNIAVGYFAGLANTGSNNIYLGANVGGVTGESNAIYLGAQGTQTKAVIAGIRGTTTGLSDAIPVLIDSAGQLGTVSSSRRFKEDIRDMGEASRAIFALRPVTFQYSKVYTDGARPLQYGLVAEEVAEVFPGLAVANAEGGVDTVHYETLSVLLLNEMQHQQQRIQEQQQSIEALLDEAQRQQQRIEVLERRLSAFSAKPD